MRFRIRSQRTSQRVTMDFLSMLYFALPFGIFRSGIPAPFTEAISTRPVERFDREWRRVMARARWCQAYRFSAPHG